MVLRRMEMCGNISFRGEHARSSRFRSLYTVSGYTVGLYRYNLWDLVPGEYMFRCLCYNKEFVTAEYEAPTVLFLSLALAG